ncbi:claudin-10 [Girardinichthys multiradiatus]|uniref:claudin-10 n=1 Tax=Girardinichthys multiradiatus TaxID=208333 RepID=UPI001FADFD4D|nr:claudin-10 [Girardinichthys multiradiatus]
MKIRVVQIWGFLMTVLGWIFVACTMAMEGWKIASVGGMGGSAIIKVAWHWSSLWRKCFTDSTAVTNCHNFPVLWSVEGYVQIVRGLLMGALSLGMLGFILSLLGMECTYVGGKNPSKYKKIFTGGWCHIISGALSTCGYAVYAEHVSVENLNPLPNRLNYDLGTPLFLGWVGSAFHMTGGFFYLWSVFRPLCGGGRERSIKPQPDLEKNKSTTASSAISEVTPNTKLSSISKLSSRSKRSDVSSLSSKSGRTARSGRSSMTGRTPRSAGTFVHGSGSRSGLGSKFQSGLSLEPSLSTLSESRSRSRSSDSSRSMSSLSDNLRSGTTTFVKNSYI